MTLQQLFNALKVRRRAIAAALIILTVLVMAFVSADVTAPYTHDAPVMPSATVTATAPSLRTTQVACTTAATDAAEPNTTAAAVDTTTADSAVIPNEPTTISPTAAPEATATTSVVQASSSKTSAVPKATKPSPSAAASSPPTTTTTDRFHTAPVPEDKPKPAEPQEVTTGTAQRTCTLSVSCGTILQNMELCDPDKRELVPADGWILPPTTVTFQEGESVFDVLLRICRERKIHMEFKWTPLYNSEYIQGIGNLYEFDVGPLSGWTYAVNNWFPNYGCSRYALSDGDNIRFVYTCNMGNDVGGSGAIGG